MIYTIHLNAKQFTHSSSLPEAVNHTVGSLTEDPELLAVW